MFDFEAQKGLLFWVFLYVGVRDCDITRFDLGHPRLRSEVTVFL